MLVNIIGDKRADILQIVAGGEDAVKSHLFKLHFHIGEVMFAYNEVAADVQQNVTESAFDAAFT